MQTRTAPFSIFDFGNINATKPAPQFQETGITVTSFSGWGSGGTQPPGDWARDTLQLSDVLTYIRGSHSMHFGGTFVPWNRFDSSTGYEEEPLLTFTGAATGNGLADLLTGSVATFTQTAGKAKFTRGRQANAFCRRIAIRTTEAFDADHILVQIAAPPVDFLFTYETEESAELLRPGESPAVEGACQRRSFLFRSTG